jgi:hypothetical protein
LTKHLTLWSDARLAKVTQPPDLGKALKTREESSCSLMETWPTISSQNGSFGKTPPAFYPLTEGMISKNSLICWENGGMASYGVSLTLNFSERPSAAAVRLLSNILETSTAPPRYYLIPQGGGGGGYYGWRWKKNVK